MNYHRFSAKQTAEACLRDYVKKGFRGYILTLNQNSYEVRIWK
jgi:hypothetical protein